MKCLLILHTWKENDLREQVHFRLQRTIWCILIYTMGSAGKESACSAGDTGDMGLIPWIRNISPEEEMATHSSIRAWRIPWTEEPGSLQSLGSQRVGHDWASNAFTFKLLVVENRHCNCSPGSCPGAANGVSRTSHWTSPGLTPLQLHVGVWWHLPRLSPRQNWH